MGKSRRFDRSVDSNFTIIIWNHWNTGVDLAMSYKVMEKSWFSPNGILTWTHLRVKISPPEHVTRLTLCQIFVWR